MASMHPQPKRGRPKTLGRDDVLQTAMMSYWADGPTAVPINEICRRSGASKPGIYREFGSDDGLKEAALVAYHDAVLTPLHNILASDQTFGQVVEALILFFVQDRQPHGLPDGCLFVAMRAHRDELGDLTRAKVDQLRQETLAAYERWINRAKSNGEFKLEIPSNTAAFYFDAQNGSAMRMQKEGVANDIIEQTLRLAFDGLR